MIAVQCKMARVALGLGVRELAELADVSPDTIARLERGEILKARTIAAVRATLEEAGVEFIPENGGGAGVRLKKLREYFVWPIDSDQRVWEASTFKNAVWICATSPDDARNKLSEAFAVAVEHKPGLPNMGSPWKLPKVTLCEEKRCPYDIKAGAILDEVGRQINWYDDVARSTIPIEDSNAENNE
jgi:transcriptional regulator with XRE-family HTH domain